MYLHSHFFFQVIPEEISILEIETRNSERLQKSSETSEYDAPDGGYGWVIVAVSFLAITVVDGVINSFGIFLSEFVKEFKVSEGKIAWVGSILAGVPLLVGPIASVLTNKFGCRTTCAIGKMFFNNYIIYKSHYTVHNFFATSNV